ncbi:MAG: hypothetical protein ACTSQU_11810 [Promethearchaeota archaeon]
MTELKEELETKFKKMLQDVEEEKIQFFKKIQKILHLIFNGIFVVSRDIRNLIMEIILLNSGESLMIQT